MMDLHDQHTTAWLSTTGSQIFFMQLGFLCYEVGFVKPVWTQSVILKNIEDTFVGILTFLAFGFTLSESKDSFYGIIAIPVNPLLINVDKDLHDQILISAFFASTCATVISGAVLERMKNKAYITWCLLTILINYSFVSHWIWHKEGWLSKLGFVDGAGSIVVHSTAGMAALIAIWRLGPRSETVDRGGTLLPIQHAARPIINAIGAFFLWYGWFAFNVSSPIAWNKGIGDAIGTTALVTVISPIASTCAAFIWMHFGWTKLSFESLLSCLLAGLVSITGMCHTCDIWEAFVTGVFASVVYFNAARLVRMKWKIDDPLQVVAIHLFCGIYSGIAEGIVGNDVYGTPGLVHGEFKHFFVQLLGVAFVIIFNFCLSLFLWDIVLQKWIFRNEDIRVSILDIYLGTRLFDQNYDMALDEVLSCKSNAGKRMLFQFHEYVCDRYASEQLDFLIVVKIFNNYLNKKNSHNHRKIAKFILQIIDTYISENGSKCINISGTQRSILMKIQNQLISELKHNEKPGEKQVGKKDEKDRSLSLMSFQPGFYKSGMDIRKESVFKPVYHGVWRIVLPHFTQFLRHSFTPSNKKKFEIKIPFKLSSEWIIEWDTELIKDTERMRLADTVPNFNSSGSLLRRLTTEQQIDFLKKTNDDNIQIELVGTNDSYPIIFVDDKAKKNAKDTARAVVIIE